MKWKKALCVVLLLCLTMLVGCSSNRNGKKEETNADMENTNQLKIVASIYAPYDLAKQVVGEYGQVTMLLPPGSESHTYEPTPQDIISIQNCDVFVYVGGESDTWIKDVLDDIDTSDVKIISLMDQVDLLEEEVVEGMEVQEHTHEEEMEEHEHEEEIQSEESHKHEEEMQSEKSYEHDDAEYDEHIWTSPKNAISIVEHFQEVFMEVDTEHKDAYQTQGDAYIEQLQELDKEFREGVENGERDTLIFGDRFPLRYFVEEYGLKYYAAFPGCAEDTEPSAATVAFLIDKVREEQIPVVFHIELSNENMTDTICDSTGATKEVFYSCHNISKEDFEKGVTYLELMKQNVEVLRKALGSKAE